MKLTWEAAARLARRVALPCPRCAKAMFARLIREKFPGPADVQGIYGPQVLWSCDCGYGEIVEVVEGPTEGRT